MSQPVVAPSSERRHVREWLRYPPAWVTAITLSVAFWAAAIVLTETPVSPIVVAGAAPFVALSVALLSAVDRIRHRVVSALVSIPCVAALAFLAFELVPLMPHIYP